MHGRRTAASCRRCRRASLSSWWPCGPFLSGACSRRLSVAVERSLQTASASGSGCLPLEQRRPGPAGPSLRGEGLVEDLLDVSTSTNSSSRLVSAGRSSRSCTFSRGRMIRFRPARCAARTFSRTPPIGKTCPVSVISPVIPTSSATGMPRTRDAIAVAIVTPADGPSFGTAPAGTWMWTSCFANQSVARPSSSVCERTQESAACADSCITSPSCPVIVSFPCRGRRSPR